MSYEMIRIPLAKTTVESTKAELRAYYEWHQRVLPERLDQLARLVRSWAPTSHWAADRSRDSLRHLGDWLAAHLEFAPTPEAELARQRALLPPGTPISTYEPTMRMRSIAYDIGLYFGECMIAAFPSLSWQLVLDNKRHAEYGHVAVAGYRAGNKVLNPARIVLVCVGKLHDGSATSMCLHDLYGTWSEYI